MASTPPPPSPSGSVESSSSPLVRMASALGVHLRTPGTRALEDATRARALDVTNGIFADAGKSLRRGDAQSALAGFQQAADAYHRYLKPGDLMIAKALNNVAVCHERINQPAEAAAAYAKAQRELETGLARSSSLNPFARRQSERLLKHVSRALAAVPHSGAKVGGGVAGHILLERGRALRDAGKDLAAKGDVGAAVMVLDNARQALEAVGPDGVAEARALAADLDGLRRRLPLAIATPCPPPTSLTRPAAATAGSGGAASPAALSADEGARTVDSSVGGYDGKRCPATGRYKAVCECAACHCLGPDALGTDEQAGATVESWRRQREEELARLRAATSPDGLVDGSPVDLMHARGGGGGDGGGSGAGEAAPDRTGGGALCGAEAGETAVREGPEGAAQARAAGPGDQGQPVGGAQPGLERPAGSPGGGSRSGAGEETAWREGAAASSEDEEDRAPEENDPETAAIIEEAIDHVNRTRDDMNRLQVAVQTAERALRTKKADTDQQLQAMEVSLAAELSDASHYDRLKAAAQEAEAEARGAMLKFKAYEAFANGESGPLDDARAATLEAAERARAEEPGGVGQHGEDGELGAPGAMAAIDDANGGAGQSSAGSSGAARNGARAAGDDASCAQERAGGAPSTPSPAPEQPQRSAARLLTQLPPTPAEVARVERDGAAAGAAGAGLVRRGTAVADTSVAEVLASLERTAKARRAAADEAAAACMRRTLALEHTFSLLVPLYVCRAVCEDQVASAQAALDEAKGEAKAARRAYSEAMGALEELSLSIQRDRAEQKAARACAAAHQSAPAAAPAASSATASRRSSAGAISKSAVSPATVAGRAGPREGATAWAGAAGLAPLSLSRRSSGAPLGLTRHSSAGLEDAASMSRRSSGPASPLAMAASGGGPGGTRPVAGAHGAGPSAGVLLRASSRSNAHSLDSADEDESGVSGQDDCLSDDELSEEEEPWSPDLAMLAGSAAVDGALPVPDGERGVGDALLAATPEGAENGNCPPLGAAAAASGSAVTADGGGGADDGIRSRTASPTAGPEVTADENHDVPATMSR